MILSIFSALCQGTAIFIIGMIYDRFLMNTPDWTQVFGAFLTFCIISLVCYIMNNLTSYILTIVMIRISEYHVCYNMRKDLFGKLQRLPIKYFDTTPSGELITRSSNDVDNIS